jgi:hypothetical protein
MSPTDKAARGLALGIALAVIGAADAANRAWRAHLDALTAADMAAADLAWERSGARQAAEAMVVYQMALEGRCAPSVPQAAAVPCREGGPIAGVPRWDDGAVWTVAP